ncbi:MAG: ImmA/IrrE family metallo-endopeptidase [Actinobacteria bacterium]|nr:ImmA/IrrE family metallo-endopeptidase [Actinomycetota bacterium]
MTVKEPIATLSPEEDADKVLQRYWNFGGITTLPVDPIFIARQMGIQVLETRLDSGVSGMLVKQHDAPPTIYLNEADSRVRQRFTCAHELGHWMKRSLMKDDWAFVDHRAQLSGRGTDPSERYSNAFAAALLMPASQVQALSGHARPESLARHFEVSGEAMRIRLDNLRSAGLG